MKTEDQIRARVRDLKVRYLQRMLRARLRRRPHNCQFNKEHTFERDGQKFTVRLCMLGMERPDWSVDICETPKQAASCPAFLPAVTKEALETEFEARLTDPEVIRTKYRDLAALAWVLGDLQSPKYTLPQRFWLFLTSWWTPKSRQIPAEGTDDDEDRD